MNKEEFLKHPLLKDISQQKKDLLIELVEQVEGAPLNKALPALVKTNARMKALGLTFTKDESALIVQVINDNLSSADRIKYDAMQKALKKKSTHTN